MITIVKKGLFKNVEDINDGGIYLGNVMSLIDSVESEFDYTNLNYYGDFSTILGRHFVSYTDGQNIRMTSSDPILDEAQIARELALIAQNGRVGSLSEIKQMYTDIYKNRESYTIVHLP